MCPLTVRSAASVRYAWSSVPGRRSAVLAVQRRAVATGRRRRAWWFVARRGDAFPDGCAGSQFGPVDRRRRDLLADLVLRPSAEDVLLDRGGANNCQFAEPAYGAAPEQIFFAALIFDLDEQVADQCRCWRLAAKSGKPPALCLGATPDRWRACVTERRCLKYIRCRLVIIWIAIIDPRSKLTADRNEVELRAAAIGRPTSKIEIWD